MAPPSGATAAARRSAARAQPRPAAPRRPPLRLFEPTPRRKPGTRRLHRPAMWLSALLVLGSLLAVVVGDTLMAEGQVRLTTTEHALAAAVTIEKAAQVAVAEKAAPPVVVSQARTQGLVTPAQVVYLPQVPLDVPLPVPQITPGPGSATPKAVTPASPSRVPATR